MSLVLLWALIITDWHRDSKRQQEYFMYLKLLSSRKNEFK